MSEIKVVDQVPQCTVNRIGKDVKLLLALHLKKVTIIENHSCRSEKLPPSCEKAQTIQQTYQQVFINTHYLDTYTSDPHVFVSFMDFSLLADRNSPPTAVSPLLYHPLPQQIYCHRFQMASGDSEYTSLDFLSKIRLQPKRNIFKHLSLDTDLEEINQVLSPKATPPPTTLDRELTRRFVLEVITKYEGEGQANNKWEGFLKSMGDAETFEVFVQSLKDINDDRKPDPPANPESESNKETPGEARRGGRSTSCKKLAIRQEKKQEQKAGAGVLKRKIREEVNHLKDLLMAGERFLREARNDY